MKLKIILFFVRNYLEILALFSTPRKGRLSPQDRQFLDSSAREILFYNDVKIQCYKWQGGDKTVLLMHGWESNSARWKSLIKLLRNKDFTVVAFDAPAHGDSGSPYFHPPLYAEMANIVVQKYLPMAVVGHSVGGYTTAYLTHFKNPPSVEKLVLMAPACDNRLIFNTYFNFIGVGSRVREAFYFYIKNQFKRTPDEIVADGFAKNFKQKGLIIHDKKDEIVMCDEGRKIHAAWPTAQYVETEGLGHSLRNEGVHKTVVDFICNF